MKIFKKFLVLFVACLLQSAAFSQYWQQKVDYIIDVTLDEKEKAIDAFEKITYTNNSPDTLRYIWFHLWPNAYKNDRTAFSDQLLENDKTSFYFSSKEQRGYINKLDFKVDGLTANTEDHPHHIDITKLLLPKPLAPGQSIVISTPFHVKLSFNSSRGGYDGTSFQVTQWYPKPAVYDSHGWHPIPYLDQGEFYSEFGSFDVKITVPENYIVAATGNLQNTEELQSLRSMKASTKLQEGEKNLKTQSAPVKSTATKTLQYTQDSVHDFAWFADKDFIVNSDTCMLPSGKMVEVFTYYTPPHAGLWKHSLQYAKDALRFYSKELGEYPYGTASVVQGPASFGGGMEYPTITIISPSSSAKELDIVIAHELGHNWFYGILASNERAHPWMDEGMNSFYERKYSAAKYGADRAFEILFQTKAKRRTDQPIETTSEDFSSANYGPVAYYKTAEWMRLMEKKLGEVDFRKMMQEYYEKWKFKHPQPGDFKTVASGWLHTDTDSVFSLLTQKGMLPGNEFEGFSVLNPLKPSSIKNYIQNPTKNSILISPALGYNRYNQVMLGAVVTNYKLPPSNFQFLLAPLYGTGSRSLAGLAKFNYTMHSNGWLRKSDVFVNASRFSMDRFTDAAGVKKGLHFNKLVPGFKLTLREKNVRSTLTKTFQWKTFFINEESLHISVDTIINGNDTLAKYRYHVLDNHRYLNQFQFTIQNFRALYPYDITVQVEHGQGFLRPTITTNYFFNYASGGGLNMRFFAGKFIYLPGKTFQNEIRTDRFHLNMSGPTGFEDYTYSDYFVGRNDFQNFPSRQMMIRDGAFKVRTDLLGRNKVGKSDDWIVALNFSSNIPQKLNPLSLMPIKIPLKIFADVGSYATPWEKNTELDRFLFDAGLQVTLLKGAVDLYFPIVYSKIFRDYYKVNYQKNLFLKTMSFSINLFTKDLKKINREIEF